MGGLKDMPGLNTLAIDSDLKLTKKMLKSEKDR